MSRVVVEEVSPGQPSSPTSAPCSGDRGFLLITGLIALVTIWLAATPLVPSVARATMRRFHLRDNSFLVWAIQQPIPAMYNFANRYRVWEGSPAPPPEATAGHSAHQIGDPAELLESGCVNHFPSRMITFANARYRLLAERADCWFELESAYRGQRLTTRLHLCLEDGAWRCRRVLEGAL